MFALAANRLGISNFNSTVDDDDTVLFKHPEPGPSKKWRDHEAGKADSKSFIFYSVGFPSNLKLSCVMC